MRFTLSLTHRCNLACGYCYAGNSSKQDMEFSTAQKIIDFALSITPPGKRAEFSFFGGEPLLCFDLVRQITGYIRQQQAALDRQTRLSITTNGTLLSQPVLEFVKQEGIDLCVSLDGPAQVHDVNRCYRDGRGSFELVFSNLQIAKHQIDALQVNAVYGPDNVAALPQTASFLIQFGVPAIHLNPDILATWPANIGSRLQRAYMQIADQYIDSYERDQEIALNLIDSKVILFLKKGYTAEDMCGMGETEWGFAPSGNVYPCERFIGEDDGSLCIGNIHTGIDPTRRCSLIRHRGNRNRECQTCNQSRYCMNWCGCTNHFMTGHTDLVGTMFCQSERAAIQAAQHAFITLSERKNELFIDHCLRYLYEGRHD